MVRKFIFCTYKNSNQCYDAFKGRIMMVKKILLLALGMLYLLNTPVFAETYEISGSGKYVAGASESLNDAKQHALEEAMRQVVEKAGVMVTSYSQLYNAELTKDETTIIASRIIKIKNKSFNTKLVSDSGIEVLASIDAVVNTDDIDLNKIKADNTELNDKYNKLREENEYNAEKIKAQDDYNKLSSALYWKYRNGNVISESYYKFLKEKYKNKKAHQIPFSDLESMFKRCMYDNRYSEAGDIASIGALDSYSPIDTGHYALLEAEVYIVKQSSPTMALRLLNDVKRVIPNNSMSLKSDREKFEAYYQIIDRYVKYWTPKMYKYSSKTVYFYGDRTLKNKLSN